MPLVTIVAVAVAGFSFSELYKVKQNPQVQFQKEVNDLVSKVSKLIVLPSGELPTVATVSDLEALKDQPFFAKAKKGDKVLIYTTSKRVVLYSVADNKILDVAPLNIGGGGN